MITTNYRIREGLPDIASRLAVKLGVNQQIVRQQLARMLRDGEVRQTGEVVNNGVGQPSKVWELA